MPFSASSTCYYLNNQTVILVFTIESSVGLLSELTLEMADLPQAHLFYFGLVSYLYSSHARLGFWKG